ncbi:hypothetical protein FOL47_009428 [Perkinsus chesapeaki]|uniref:Uncharacterized protein n=1 Tax=Perkinsus chesapeaki TaxID=330153 RepID=A0A7J6L8B1_PERCH|nr:hypothetical protein FOL47_009428 [Perkinsus chesapeaki]
MKNDGTNADISDLKLNELPPRKCKNRHKQDIKDYICYRVGKNVEGLGKLDPHFVIPMKLQALDSPIATEFWNRLDTPGVRARSDSGELTLLKAPKMGEMISVQEQQNSHAPQDEPLNPSTHSRGRPDGDIGNAQGEQSPKLVDLQDAIQGLLELGTRPPKRHAEELDDTLTPLKKRLLKE